MHVPSVLIIPVQNETETQIDSIKDVTNRKSVKNSKPMLSEII